MKKVICVYNGFPKGVKTARLTIGKIYDVLDIYNDVIITIIDDVGDEVKYHLTSPIDRIWFEDAIPYLREERLNKLL